MSEQTTVTIQNGIPIVAIGDKPPISNEQEVIPPVIYDRIMQLRYRHAFAFLCDCGVVRGAELSAPYMFFDPILTVDVYREAHIRIAEKLGWTYAQLESVLRAWKEEILSASP